MNHDQVQLKLIVMVRIVISRTKQKKYYFIVESTQQEILLTSGLYASKNACKKGIAALKKTAKGIGRYQWLEENNTVSLVIKSINGHKLATSASAHSFAELTKILSTLKAEVPNAIVMDLTIRLKSNNLY